MDTGQINVTDNILRFAYVTNNNYIFYIYIKLNVYNLGIFNSIIWGFNLACELK